MNAPVYFNQAVFLQNSVTPGTLKPRDNVTTQYYIRYLLKRAMSVFKYNNIPESWNLDFVKYCLYCYGKVVVYNSSKYGVVPQACTLGGYGLYWQPTYAIITNPALPVAECGRYWLYDNPPAQEDVLGRCVLIKLQPDYAPLIDVCTITAERLAYMHEALIMNLANSKLSYVIGAADKGAAETFKAAIDQIQAGNLAVACGKNLWDSDTGKPLWEGFANNLKQNYIATELLENMRSEFNNFDGFVGIPSTNYNKKAHMTEEEIAANDVETESLVDNMYECLTKGFAEVNRVYGLNISIEKRYKNGDDNNGNDVNNPSRIV